MTRATDVLQGTLDLLILKALSLAPLHGWGITNRIQEMSRDAFRIGQGSLYPALHRYETRGWVTSYWRGGPRHTRPVAPRPTTISRESDSGSPGSSFGSSASPGGSAESASHYRGSATIDVGSEGSAFR